MMDPSEINNFEDQWRKALKEASEAPPQSVWEGIEARLDEGNKKGLILPLWWQSSKVWYAAASIAALLLVGGGIWYGSRDSRNTPDRIDVAVSQQAAKSSAREKAQAAHKEEPGHAVPKDSQLADNSTGDSGAETGKSRTEDRQSTGFDASVKKSKGTVSRQSETNSPDEQYIARQSVVEDIKVSKKAFSDQKSVVNSADRPVDQDINNIAAVKEPEKNTMVNDMASSGISADALAALPYSELDVHVQKRYVFFRPDIKSEEPVQASKHKEYWAGLNLMPASFNPDLKLKEAPLAFANQTVANKKSVSGSSEAGVSYALQTQGGMRLSKHWSVELGLSYLQGNSDYIGGGYVLSAYNSQSSNVLEDALAGLAGSPSPNTDKSAGFVNNGALYIDVAKKVSNNYQYLQLPVQAGFTLNPDKKLSYSVLGGMMANFFLTNQLESASGEIITTTASDEIYRSTNWSATTGLRFNYRLSSKWKASLTGSYQKAITSGFRSNQSLDSHPYLYGVAWGVRYSF